MKQLVLLAMLAVVTLLAAQTTSKTEKSAPAPKAAATPKPSGPTKVTGQPQTTASGVEYWDIQVGTGKTAVAGKKLSMHYTGWLTDGKQFDSSRGHRGEPFQFTLGQGQVIKGWDEGVAGMKVGGKRQLKIPPSAGYGASGAGKVIPPNATLIFDVELLEVK
jgi:FKBP-type peptidyl-prolyl cis-trans isomerase